MSEGAANDIKLSATPIQAHRTALQSPCVAAPNTAAIAQTACIRRDIRDSFRAQENDKGNALCGSCRSAGCASSTHLHQQQKLQYR